jgi:hypothetical protein
MNSIAEDALTVNESSVISQLMDQSMKKGRTVAEGCLDENTGFRTLEMDTYDSALPYEYEYVSTNGHLW